jgi:hypothetical protein
LGGKINFVTEASNAYGYPKLIAASIKSVLITGTNKLTVLKAYARNSSSMFVTYVLFTIECFHFYFEKYSTDYWASAL